MPYTFHPSVIAARRRHGGQSVFLTEADCWSPFIAEAELIEDEAHGDIRMLEAEISASGLHDVRLAPVIVSGGAPERLVMSAMTAA